MTRRPEPSVHLMTSALPSQARAEVERSMEPLPTYEGALFPDMED
jgi:hypothetical protein